MKFLTIIGGFLLALVGLNQPTRTISKPKRPDEILALAGLNQPTRAISTTKIPDEINVDVAFKTFVETVKMREGRTLTVIKDLDGLAVGYGHKVLSKDNLHLGDIITEEKLMQFFVEDSSDAFDAAMFQANALRITDAEFVAALASVNFQLGSNWFKIHVKTWGLLMAKRYREASIEVTRSIWFQQTPTRVNDFSDAMIRLANKTERTI